MTERVTIVIEPSAEHGDSLTVEDAMRQVLDFIEVVSAAASDDVRSKLNWRLAEASTNSPFTATAEAFSSDPEWPNIDLYARDAKARVHAAFEVVGQTGVVPSWLEQKGASQFKGLLKRNLNGIGRTTYKLNDDAPIVVVERRARSTLDKMELVATERKVATPDFSGDEFGSVEGNVTKAITHYGKPAIRIRDRLSGKEIVCVLPPAIASRIGKDHAWDEVWSGERVLVTGRVKRSSDGTISVVTAEDITTITSKPIVLEELVDKNISAGMSPAEYISELWD